MVATSAQSVAALYYKYISACTVHFGEAENLTWGPEQDVVRCTCSYRSHDGFTEQP